MEDKQKSINRTPWQARGRLQRDFIWHLDCQKYLIFWNQINIFEVAKRGLRPPFFGSFFGGAKNEQT